MNADADRLDLAAEYVLGTLDAIERDEAEALIQSDAAFAALVHDWERKLGELSAMVEPVSPPPELWMAIQGRLAEITPTAAVRLPEFLERPVASPETEIEAGKAITEAVAPEPGPVTAAPAAPAPAETDHAETAPAGPLPAEIAPAETDHAETAPAGPLPVEIAAAEPGPAEAAPAEPGPAETGPAETGPAVAEPASPSVSAPATADRPDGAATAVEPAEGGLEPADRTNVIDLTRRLRRWRGSATALGALAAALAGIVVTAALAPGYLPKPLRPKPEIRTVEVPREVVRTVEVPAPAPGRFVAVLQSSATAPAFILTVDVAQRNLTVRRVAAESQTDHSYELWLISDRFQQPHSLGLIGISEFTRAPTLASYDPATISDATFAVSLEPEGGSPTGQPTGPVLFSGKLVEAVPPAAR